MEPFAFLIHPIDVRRDVARKYPLLGLLPERVLEWLLTHREPLAVAEMRGIRSVTGATTHGWLIGCPLSPRQFLELPLEFVYGRMEECGRIAEALGAKILGLGAFTSVVGDGGITLARRLSIAVTTGNSYTVATAIEGTREVARLMGIELATASAAVVGASGSIGATCAELLARDVARVALIGRSQTRLQTVFERLQKLGKAAVTLHTNVAEGLREADVVVTVSSAAEAIVEPEFLKRGAVVCDVARPRDVSIRVARERNDVLVIESGVVQVPGAMECLQIGTNKPFNFGFPPKTAYACMSETMALALEGRYESFTLGKEVHVKQVDEITEICTRHGFRLAGFRSFERAVSEDEIERIRKRAGR